MRPAVDEEGATRSAEGGKKPGIQGWFARSRVPIERRGQRGAARIDSTVASSLVGLSSLQGWLEASRVKRGGQSRTVAVDDEQGNRLASALARLSV